MGAGRRLVAPLVGLLAAVVPMIAVWGFTVDDALISARYAHNIANGHGHRFNVLGPWTDGVTPLPWPWILAPFARAGVEQTLLVAKVIGAICWACAAAVLAASVATVVPRARWWGWGGVLLVVLTPSVTAWGVSGMETGAAIALATLVVSASRLRMTGSLIAGCVAMFRPEMVIWAVVMGVGRGLLEARESANEKAAARNIVGRTILHAVVAAAPFVGMSVLRMAMFGSVAPLALRAKPSDLQHGLVYAAATLLIAGPPLAVIAPRGWLSLALWPRVILAAFAAHTLTVVAVGGDWMPMSRLFAPVLPSLAVVFAHLTSATRWPSSLVRCALCAAGQGWVWFRVGVDAGRVGDDRAALISHAHAELRADSVVAALDVGWVGAAHSGDVMDLAGLTDPDIASLPGGHTTKAVTPMLLAGKRVSTIVLLLPAGVGESEAWERGRYARGVESRIARMGWVRDRFHHRATIGTREGLRYVLLEAPGN